MLGLFLLTTVFVVINVAAGAAEVVAYEKYLEWAKREIEQVDSECSKKHHEGD